MNKCMKDWTPEAKKRHAEKLLQRDKDSSKDSSPEATIVRQRYLAKITDDFPRY